MSNEDSSRFLRRPDRKGSPPTQTIEVIGMRFGVRLQYNKGPWDGNYTYPGYARNPRELGRRALPSPEIPTIRVPVSLHQVQSLEFTDNTANGRRIDVMSLLPPGWTLLAVVPLEKDTRRVASFLRQHGISRKEIEEYLRMLLPIAPFPDRKYVGIPIARLPQGRKPNVVIDHAAEGIVYNIGMAQASPEDPGQLMQVNQYAREFLQRTLGGRLHLLQQ